MRRTIWKLETLAIIIGLSVGTASVVAAQQRLAQPATQRMQGTRDMHVACVARDSARTFQRAVGDSLTRTNSGGEVMRSVGDTTRRVTGGTDRSHEYPEYDV